MNFSTLSYDGKSYGDFFPSDVAEGLGERDRMMETLALDNEEYHRNATQNDLTQAVDRTITSTENFHEDDEEDIEESGKGTMEETCERTPWEVDWISRSHECVDKALQDYNRHANSLLNAIATFVNESNSIYTEWDEILRSEKEESQRLDEIDPVVYEATRVGEGELLTYVGNHPKNND